MSELKPPEILRIIEQPHYNTDEHEIGKRRLSTTLGWATVRCILDNLVVSYGVPQHARRITNAPKWATVNSLILAMPDVGRNKPYAPTFGFDYGTLNGEGVDWASGEWASKTISAHVMDKAGSSPLVANQRLASLDRTSRFMTESLAQQLDELPRDEPVTWPAIVSRVVGLSQVVFDATARAWDLKAPPAISLPERSGVT